MSVLQFISSIAWPLVVLIAFTVLICVVRWSSPDTRRAMRTAFLDRDLNVTVPGGLEVGWSVPPEAVRAATATDEALAQDQTGRPAVADETRELRRDAVEQIIKSSLRAGWGFGRGALGTATTLDAEIEWVGESPVITLEFKFPGPDGQSLEADGAKNMLARHLAGRTVGVTLTPNHTMGGSQEST
jgi:hypothetical protein